jgi:hypothetical protein
MLCFAFASFGVVFLLLGVGDAVPHIRFFSCWRGGLMTKIGFLFYSWDWFLFFLGRSLFFLRLDCRRRFFFFFVFFAVAMIG